MSETYKLIYRGPYAVVYTHDRAFHRGIETVVTKEIFDILGKGSDWEVVKKEEKPRAKR